MDHAANQRAEIIELQCAAIDEESKSSKWKEHILLTKIMSQLCRAWQHSIMANVSVRVKELEKMLRIRN